MDGIWNHMFGVFCFSLKFQHFQDLHIFKNMQYLLKALLVGPLRISSPEYPDSWERYKMKFCGLSLCLCVWTYRAQWWWISWSGSSSTSSGEMAGNGLMAPATAESRNTPCPHCSGPPECDSLLTHSSSVSFSKGIWNISRKLQDFVVKVSRFHQLLPSIYLFSEIYWVCICSCWKSVTWRFPLCYSYLI